MLETLADLAFEIGIDLRKRDNSKAAVKWFERCCDILSGPLADGISHDAVELKLSVMGQLGMVKTSQIGLSKPDSQSVRAYLSLNNDEALQKANDFITLMENVGFTFLNVSGTLLTYAFRTTRAK